MLTQRSGERNADSQFQVCLEEGDGWRWKYQTQGG